MNLLEGNHTPIGFMLGYKYNCYNFELRESNKMAYWFINPIQVAITAGPSEGTLKTFGKTYHLPLKHLIVTPRKERVRNVESHVRILA